MKFLNIQRFHSLLATPSSEQNSNNQFLMKIAYVSRNVEMSVNFPTSDKPIKTILIILPTWWTLLISVSIFEFQNRKWLPV